MEIVYVLIPIALVLSLAGLVAFIWAVRSDQMDDLETPAMRILFDDDDLSKPRDTIKESASTSEPDR